MKPLGDGFIKLIKMCIPPIIFFTIVTFIVGSTDLKSVGKIGIKTLIYFEILTNLALIRVLTVASLLKAGLLNYVGQKTSFVDFLLHIIPKTVFEVFVSGEILPILFVVVLSGFALVAVREKAQILMKKGIRLLL